MNPELDLSYNQLYTAANAQRKIKINLIEHTNKKKKTNNLKKKKKKKKKKK